ncbi:MULTISPECIES: hypothetical protein [Paenibacillus]|jgi:hypothetical protein|nr:hypothetical protein [Paenibacillus polymyxa]
MDVLQSHALDYPAENQYTNKKANDIMPVKSIQLGGVYAKDHTLA